MQDLYRTGLPIEVRLDRDRRRLWINDNTGRCLLRIASEGGYTLIDERHESEEGQECRYDVTPAARKALTKALAERHQRFKKR